MQRMSIRFMSLLVLTLALAAPAMAYNVVNTSAPQVNCIFATNCVNPVISDMVSPLPSGGRIQSRIQQGQPGSPAAGKWLYKYRVDMTNAVGILSIPYVSSMYIANWGPVRQYDYNFDLNATDHVFNVTVGGIGTKGISASFIFFNTTFFNLGSNVYGGGSPGTGESSYFWGLVSDYPPVVRNATVQTDNGAVTVSVYAPSAP
jgi:hypothetical protein